MDDALRSVRNLALTVRQRIVDREVERSHSCANILECFIGEQAACRHTIQFDAGSYFTNHDELNSRTVSKRLNGNLLPL